MGLIKLSEYCKNCRLSTGLSANAFAKQLGVSHTYITDLEAGKKDNPSIAMLLKIIRLFGFTKEDITKIDVDPLILDDASVFSVIVSPSENSPVSFTQSDLIRKISQELEKKDYSFSGSPEGTMKSKTSISIKCENSKIGYLYDLKGKNPEGSDAFLCIFNSSQRRIYDDEYISYIFQFISVVESSIRYGRANDASLTEDVEIIFATTSIRGYRLAEELISGSESLDHIKRTVFFYENRRRPLSTNTEN